MRMRSITDVATQTLRRHSAAALSAGVSIANVAPSMARHTTTSASVLGPTPVR